ncbi:hypothetical protein CF65_00181 [Aggregatibacter actinomycetemcomitans HK1651]|nr:hypothetical protein CF65_00181 [Aggregatibacter actinomycetemcomitans HK1651]
MRSEKTKFFNVLKNVLGIGKQRNELMNKIFRFFFALLLIFNKRILFIVLNCPSSLCDYVHLKISSSYKI